MDKLNVAILVSGGGTNLQALIDASKRGELQGANLSLVISNKVDAYALERAKKEDIKAEFVSGKDEDKLISLLKDNNVDVVVLAGYLAILSEKVVKEYENRIINIHPSLIPSFCGKGFYGLKVHEEALKYGVKVTGATVHFVNEIPDGGKIIMQKAVYIDENDTKESLQKRVMEEAEWVILPKALTLVCEKILKNRKNM